MLHVAPKTITPEPSSSEFDLDRYKDRPASALAATMLPFDVFQYIEDKKTAGTPISARYELGQRRLVTELWEAKADFDLEADKRLSYATKYLTSVDSNYIKQVYGALLAQEYIRLAREFGLDLMPWRMADKEAGVLTWERDGGGLSDAAHKLAFHPITAAVREFPGIVTKAICHEFGVDEDDPLLCQKVDAVLAARKSEERAS